VFREEKGVPGEPKITGTSKKKKTAGSVPSQGHQDTFKEKKALKDGSLKTGGDGEFGEPMGEAAAKRGKYLKNPLMMGGGGRAGE